MEISYLIRSLLSKEVVHALVIKIHHLYKNKQDNKFEIYPSEVNNCLDNAYADQTLWEIDSNAYTLAIDNCYKNDELEILELLKANMIIQLEYNSGEDGGSCIAEIKIINKKLFENIYKWVIEKNFIINYGLFSLNKISGDSYFKENYHAFKPGSGYYSLFKSFLLRKNHILLFEEIVNIQQQEFTRVNGNITRLNYVCDERNNLQLKYKASENIQYLKRKLKMRDGFGKLFKTFEKKGFILLPDLI